MTIKTKIELTKRHTCSRIKKKGASMSFSRVAPDIEFLVDKVKAKHSHLQLAKVAVCFDESKPFVKNKINLGKVLKFNALNRLWQSNKYDFCIVIPSDLWTDVLTTSQKEAYIDLQLCRCVVEYEPETSEDAKGKKKPVKDEWGRVKFSTTIKTDKDGEPKWNVVPIDFEVLSKNISHYGLWLEEFSGLKDAVLKAK